uniref:Uncharacterized protein n=1 Tax=Calcidiscus leptoporus TaxID=127549 RepID=A0A7S0IYW6_9EUKA
MRAAYAPHVDSYVALTPTTMSNLTVVGVNGAAALQRKRRFKMNNGYGAIGGGAYKPFAILHRLEQLPRGELLLWRDVNCIKHPQLLAGAAHIRQTAEWYLRASGAADDVWMPYENDQLRAKHHCKADAVRRITARATGEEPAAASKLNAAFEHPLHHASTLIVRASPAASAFLLEWLRACLMPGITSPYPDPPPRHPNYRWHTYEQCVFTLLAAQRPAFYRRHLALCYTLETESARLINPPASAATAAATLDPLLVPVPAGAGANVPGVSAHLLHGGGLADARGGACPRPTTRMATPWMPAVPTAEGLCAVVWQESPGRPPTEWKLRLRPPTRSPPTSCAPMPADVAMADTSGATGGAVLGRWRAGYCAATPDSRANDGTEAGDCIGGSLGSWPLLLDETHSWQAAARACAAMCSHCARCRFISYSLRYADCSWFATCSLDLLQQTGIDGFRTARRRRHGRGVHV